MLYKVNVTTLETFRRWATEESNGYTSEMDVVQSLAGTAVANNYMKIGGAIAYALEHPDDFREGGVESRAAFDDSLLPVQRIPVRHRKEDAGEDFMFTPQAAQIIQEASRTPGTIEVSGNRVYNVGSGVQLDLRAKADKITGLFGIDYKASFGPSSWDKYEASLQHRCYFSIFGLAQFSYVVFQMAGQREPLHIASVEQYDYSPAINNDTVVREWLEEFWSWVQARKIQHLCLPRTKVVV